MRKSGVARLRPGAIFPLVLGKTLIGTVLSALVLVSVASAGTQGRTVPLKLTIRGTGSVKVSGSKPSIRCLTVTCTRTLYVKKGSRVTLVAKPGVLGKLDRWRGACKGTSPLCRIRVGRKEQLSVTFIRPGAQTNPIPLHRAWKVGLGWTIQVLSVTPDARGLVIDNASGAPHQAASGAQLLMLDVAATYSGGGDPSLTFANNWYVKGGGFLLYLDGSDCGPSVDVSLSAPDLQTMIKNNQAVRSGQTVTGNVCFEVPSDVASALLLNATYGDTWFALR